MEKIKHRIKRQEWWYKIADSIIYQKMMHAKAYNSYLEEISFYKSIIGTSNTLIFDVGANIGTKSKIFSRLSKRVVLFEPDHGTLEILKARLKGLHNCTIIGSALSSRNATLNYYSIGNDSAYNSLSEKHINTVVKTRNILNKESDLKSYSVEAKTLAFFIEKFGTPEYLKIDVEGHEKEVIFGLDKTIATISFEANLPQFLKETMDIIDYLDVLSKGKYLYNYSFDNKLELPEYQAGKDFKVTVSNVEKKSVEIYAKLK